MAKLKDVFGAATSVVKNPDKVVTGGSRPSSNRPSGSSSRPSGGSASRPSGSSAGSSGNVTGGYNPNLTSKPGGGRNPSSGYDRSPVSGGSGIYSVSDIGKNDRFDHLTGGVDMSRRPDLAGGYATSGGYTVFYDKDGYAVRAKKGVVDYAPHLDYNAGKGTYGTSGAWTDNEMLSAADRKRIQSIQAQMQAGKLTGDEANRLANQIRSGYGYTIDKGGYVTDLGAKGAVDRRRNEWGLPTEALSDEQAYFNYLMGTDTSRKAQESGGVMSFEDYMNSGLVPQQYVPPAAGGQWTPETGGQWQGSGQWMPGGSMGGFGSGYPSFEDFLEETGYDQYAEATQDAIRAAVQNAVNGYRDQIDATNRDSDDLARQAYIAMMQGQKNLDQQMAAGGYAGGMADSQRIATETDYQNNLNEIEKMRMETVKELESAIANARLTGDMQTAQELANYLQNIQGQWMNYIQNQQQMDRQDYWNRQQMENDNFWNQQSMDRQTLENNRNWAMQQMAKGILPDDATLAAAGISKQAAQQYVGMVLGETGGGTVTQGTSQTARRSTGGGYSNGSLTRSQVQEMQKALGVTADGLWGSESKAAAGGMTADQAWAAYKGNGNGNAAQFSRLMDQLSIIMSEEIPSAAAKNIQTLIDRNWDQLSTSQQLEVNELLKRYGFIQ